jgi:hypothetical protein
MNTSLTPRDFRAITEALHRKYFHINDPDYPMRGYNTIHSYVVKACKEQYDELATLFFPNGSNIEDELSD